jgi:hypothetical protein
MSVVFLENIEAHEAAYWENRRQQMGLDDKQIGDLLRAAAAVAAPTIRKWILTKETDWAGYITRSEIVCTEETFAMECLTDGWTVEVVEVIKVLKPKETE